MRVPPVELRDLATKMKMWNCFEDLVFILAQWASTVKLEVGYAAEHGDAGLINTTVSAGGRKGRKSAEALGYEIRKNK